MFQHGQDVIFCAGENHVQNACWKLERERWTVFNELNYKRIDSSVVQMINETYVIGGWNDPQSRSSEMLQHNGSSWQMWHEHEKIAGGCVVRISDTEFLQIGGFYGDSSRIWKYSIEDGKKQHTHIRLKQPRRYHQCHMYQGRVIITGGWGDRYFRFLTILGTVTLSV